MFPAQADYVYLTKDEALKLVLGSDSEISYQPRSIPKELQVELQSAGVATEDLETTHLFIGSKSGKLTAFAFIDTQIGKHLPITFIVGVSPEGQVTRTEIMVYREKYGSQVREPAFLQQFSGKTVDDELRISEAGMRHVTGATISSKSISIGVRRNLKIWEYFFGNKHNA